MHESTSDRADDRWSLAGLRAELSRNPDLIRLVLGGEGQDSGQLAGGTRADPTDSSEDGLSSDGGIPGGTTSLGGALLKEPLPGEPVGPHIAGFCYLALVRPDARTKMRKALGRNPYMSAVFSWLQSNVSEHSSARFVFQLGLLPLDMGNKPAFLQAHVVENGRGVRLKQLMALPTLDVRLGGDRQGPGPTEIPTGGPAQVRAVVPDGGTVLDIPFAVMMKSTGGPVAFSPRTSKTIKQVLAYYESAELLSFDISCHVSGGASACLAAGFGTTLSTPASVDDFLSLPYSTLFSGNDNSLGVGDLRLPPGHSFGREVKAMALGNADPVLHLLLARDAASTASVKGLVRLRVSGRGVASPLLLAQGK